MAPYGPIGTIREYRVYLPEYPLTHSNFDFAQISLFDISGEKPAQISLTGGHVDIQQNDHKIVITLQTPEGPFWANGIYPLQ